MAPFGNLLAVFPRFEMVVVFTGANYDWNVRSVYNTMLEDYLIPLGCHPSH